MDGLVELLIQVTHRITVKAERRVIEELVEEAHQVRGKAGILFRVAEAAVGQPDGVVREVIFPVVGEQTFEALVREAQALGTPQSRRVHTAVRASYGSYYRRMMPKLLAALDFRSNNGVHRPLLDALAAIRRAEGDGRQYFPADEIAIEGVDPPQVARHRDRGCARRRKAGESHQLRNLCSSDLARAAALQGGLGRGRGPLPQS